jgi:hypothetical protein
VSDIKRCPKCGNSKSLDQFSQDRHSADGLSCYCRDCRREHPRRYRQEYPDRGRTAARKYRTNNPEAANEAVARWREANPKRYAEALARRRRAARKAVFDHYGWSCACCGSTKTLTIDHIDGDGKRHCAEIGVRTGTDMHRWLVKNGFPPGFQTLCGPCNTSKGTGDTCRLDHRTEAA